MAYVCRTCNKECLTWRTCNSVSRRCNRVYGHCAQLALGQRKSLKRLTRNQVRGRKRDKERDEERIRKSGFTYVLDVCKTCNKESLTWCTCKRNKQQRKSLKRNSRIQVRGRKRDKVKKRRGKYQQIWFKTWRRCNKRGELV